MCLFLPISNNTGFGLISPTWKTYPFERKAVLGKVSLTVLLGSQMPGLNSRNGKNEMLVDVGISYPFPIIPVLGNFSCP
jgi:hypothetical protein